MSPAVPSEPKKPVHELQQKALLFVASCLRLLRIALPASLGTAAFASFGVITPVLSVVISVFVGTCPGVLGGGKVIGGLIRKQGCQDILYGLSEFGVGLGAFLCLSSCSRGTIASDISEADSFWYLSSRRLHYLRNFSLVHLDGDDFPLHDGLHPPG
jgi:hypothetical protein